MALLIALAVAGTWLVRRHLRARSAAIAPAAAMQGEPHLMLWAWETPEDLRQLDPAKAGVAFLAREVLLGRQAQVRPRRQPLQVAEGAWLMAVVRIETSPGFSALAAPSALQDEVAQDILAATQEKNVRGLQIDFDALASQRDFYAAVLRKVRQQLPVGLPLSMTALTSWCGDQSWLSSLPSGALPIDEAVPMFFRMGGPAATRATAPRDTHAFLEPACAGSIGIATGEVWPNIHKDQRVYVFRTGPWTTKDVAYINKFGYEGLKGVASQ